MFKKIFSKIVSSLPQIVALLFIGAFAAYAWTGPTQAPPLDNTPAPLNVGLVGQIKQGNLQVNALGVQGTGNALLVPNGNVGIGTASPGAKLDIAGNIKITDGTQGAGKVLTSDAFGLGSWSTPAAGATPTLNCTDAGGPVEYHTSVAYCPGASYIVTGGGCTTYSAAVTFGRTGSTGYYCSSGSLSILIRATAICCRIVQ